MIHFNKQYQNYLQTCLICGKEEIAHKINFLHRDHIKHLGKEVFEYMISLSPNSQVFTLCQTCFNKTENPVEFKVFLFKLKMGLD